MLLGPVIMAAIQMPGVGIRGASIYQREPRAVEQREERKTRQRREKGETDRGEYKDVQCVQPVWRGKDSFIGPQINTILYSLKHTNMGVD